jgi:hypothetical protein
MKIVPNQSILALPFKGTVSRDFCVRFFHQTTSPCSGRFLILSNIVELFVLIIDSPVHLSSGSQFEFLRLGVSFHTGFLSHEVDTFYTANFLNDYHCKGYGMLFKMRKMTP